MQGQNMKRLKKEHILIRVTHQQKSEFKAAAMRKKETMSQALSKFISRYIKR